MMKRIFIPFLFIFLSHFAIAQSAGSLFGADDKPVTWLGLDFSHFKMIGEMAQFQDHGEATPSTMRSKYFPAWNMLIFNEQKRYDVNGMFRQNELLFDLDMVSAKNAKANLSEMESYNTPNYSLEQIQKYVQEYDLKGKSGIGLIFLVESFNKGKENAVIHLVALNMSTKTILIHEKYTGKPMGIGIRNYWAGSIRDVIEIIKNDYRRLRIKHTGK